MSWMDLVVRMIFCLLLAGLLGFLLGWLWRGLSCRRKMEELESTWEGRLDACRADLGKLSGERDDWKGKYEARGGELETQLGLVSSLTGERDDWKGKYEARGGELETQLGLVSSLSGERDDWKGKYEARGGELETQLGLVSSLSGERDELKARLEAEGNLSAELASCRDNVGTLARERDDLKAKFEAQGNLSAELATCRERVSSLSGERDEWKAKYENASSSAASAGLAGGALGLMGGAAAAAKPTRKDNLKRVEGIGPKIESLLNDAGIFTWSELAGTAVSTLQGVLDRAGERYRIHDPSTWPEQSGLAADGRFEELDQLQDELKGGRR